MKCGQEAKINIYLFNVVYSSALRKFYVDIENSFSHCMYCKICDKRRGNVFIVYNSVYEKYKCNMDNRKATFKNSAIHEE